MSQSFLERIGKVGTIHLCSMDSMTPELDIRHVKKPREVKELLSKTVEGCRKANGIRTSEIIGERGAAPGPAPLEHDHYCPECHHDHE